MSQAGFSLEADAELRTCNSFQVAATAPLLARLSDAAALPALFAHHAVRDRPLLVLGEGSNVLFAGDPEGVVLRPEMRGIAIEDDVGGSVVVHAAAAESWNGLVDWTLSRGLCGLENLALIPGSVGAAPVQNIGAYGRELDTLFDSLDAFDRERGETIRMDAAACGFRYRGSRFRDEAPDRWIILGVRLRLSRRPDLRLDYPGIADMLASMGICNPLAADVAEAVRRLRRSKLPDPARIGNAGSFFKNPLVPTQQAAELTESMPALPCYPAGNGLTKLAAAFLIEAAGLKGLRRGDAGISDRHALVLVNHGSASGAELLAVALEVRDRVRQMFAVELEPEPRIVGASWR